MTGNAGQCGIYRNSTPLPLEHTGTECSGSDKAANRVLTIARETTPDMQVLAGGKPLARDTEYTATGKAITFLVKIYNTDNIVVRV